jgi:hypothetical protein
MIDGPGARGQGPRAGGQGWWPLCGRGRGPRAEVPVAEGQGPYGRDVWNQEFDCYVEIVFAILFLDRVCNRDGGCVRVRNGVSVLITRSSNCAWAQG